MKKGKKEYFQQLDTWNKLGKTPDGKDFCCRTASLYIKKHDDNYYGWDANKGVPALMSIRGFEKWYKVWYRHVNQGQPLIIKEHPTVSYFLGREVQPKVEVKAEEVPLSEIILGDRKIRALQAQLDDSKRKYKHVLGELETAEKRFGDMCAIHDPVEFEPIVPIHGKSDHECIAIAQLSDVHVGERVDPATINGMNEYTPDIADKRVANYFQNLLKLIVHNRQAVKIDTLFMSLTGDFITGYIHEELMQNNYLSPTEEVRWAKRLLIRGIDFLLNYGKFRTIIIQTNWGNHGRNTKKSTHATGYKNNYEYMLYQDIADYFRNEKKIIFNISQSNIVYSPSLFGRTVRTFHGDTMSYQGGIGGLGVPLIKYLQRLDKQRFADFSLLGHWHQRIRPTRNCLVNGSVIGFNAYAQSIGAEPEPPVQNLILLDKDRGFTVESPIFC